MTRPRLLGLCALSVLAFAANSLLTRRALGAGLAGAAAFTSLRLLSGAAVLVPLAWRRPRAAQTAGWLSALALFLYAAPFSFAYLRLRAGTGSLLLFGSVQATMFAAGLVRGERPPLRTWAGFAIAIGGLLILVAPGLEAPQPLAALSMIAAGMAWGWYSLRGRQSKDGIAASADAFARCAPAAGALWLLAPAEAPLTQPGALLAVASGALASGLGYSLWNTALPHLTRSTAAVLQLAAPALAAAGGVLLLGEPASLRLLAGAVAILGGVALAVLSRQK